MAAIDEGEAPLRSYYAYDPKTGAFRPGRDFITEAFRAAQEQDGYLLVILPPGAPPPDPLRHTVDARTGAVADLAVPVCQDDLLTLAQAKEVELRQACREDIGTGFVSAALGNPHFYPAMPFPALDQINLLLGGDIMCRDEKGVWLARTHTDAQADHARRDFVAMRDAARGELSQKTQALRAAKQPGEVAAMIWDAPSRKT
jgi:hypothetical protein